MTLQSHTERSNCEVPGWIGGPGGALCPCVIRDISKVSATLAVNESSTLPENLRLYFSPTAQTYRRCVVRWRKDGSVGVQFENKNL
jgi:hypothetical protein